MYFPQLTHAYETPQAQDWSQYGLLDPNYQPWSVQGGQQFVPENIWNYAPPQINRQPVQYGGPPMGGLMEVIMPAEESDEDPNKMTPQEMIESGLYDGNPDAMPGYGEGTGKMPGEQGYLGYMAQSNAEQNLADLKGFLSGLGISDGVDPDPTAGDDTFGLGISP
jgi:hypothetical protein